MIKLFAHRGYVENNIKQNSIASLKNAFKNGFKAIEFDVWFLDNKLILSHDKPKKTDDFSIVRFKDYLIYQNQLEYWVDFKNLDEANVNKVLEILAQNINEAKINLNQFYFAPYLTNYELLQKITQKFDDFFPSKPNLVAVCDDKSQIKDAVDLIDLGVVNFLSMKHDLIDKNLLSHIDAKKLLAWNVNDIKIINDLYQMGVDKFATDKVKI